MSQLIEQQQNTQVLRTEQPMASSMLEFIQRAASDASVDMDKLERLILMSEKMQAKSAEQSFNAAMAQMQCEIPTVGEGGLNTHTGNSYSTLDDINAALKPIMPRSIRPPQNKNRGEHHRPAIPPRAPPGPVPTPHPSLRAHNPAPPPASEASSA